MAEWSGRVTCTDGGGPGPSICTPGPSRGRWGRLEKMDGPETAVGWERLWVTDFD